MALNAIGIDNLLIGFANWQGCEAKGTNSIGAAVHLCLCMCEETELQSTARYPFTPKGNTSSGFKLNTPS